MTKTAKGRLAAGESPGMVLRECIAGPFPSLRMEALRIIRGALAEGPTVAAACRRLGLPRQTFERLKADFPEIVEVSKKST